MSDSVHHQQSDGVLIVSFSPGSGRQGQERIRRYFAQEFLPDTSPHNLVVVDLEHVATLDSSSLGPLVQRQREMEDSGGRLVLCGLRASALREIFALTRFDQIFQIVDSREEALRQLAPSPPAAADE